MTNQNKSLTYRRSIFSLLIGYELICYAGVIMLGWQFRSEFNWLLTLIVFPFVLLYLVNDPVVDRIVYTILFTFISWLGWTFLVAEKLTTFLYAHFIHEEHSNWDLFAFLLPVLFAITSFFWCLRKRRQQRRFEIICLLSVCIFWTIIPWL